MIDIQESWWEEKRSAYLYSIMANSEPHPLRKKLFNSLAQAAESQAIIWENKFKTAGGNSSKLIFKPNFRTLFVAWLIKNIGVEKLRYILSAMKIRGMSVFTQHNHERRHRGLSTASNLRAAVFGVNDGLISNVSLILGFAGANAAHSSIILAGVAGLLAGACSMAAGEYVSMRSQREVFEHQIELERSELEQYPEEEAEELSLIYQARGISPEESDRIANLLINNPDTALDTLAREELGLNPSDLGSPVGAMISSFFSFAIGATIPLAPFLMKENFFNLYLSLGLTGLALFSTGIIISLFTNQSAWRSGLRMLIIGSCAGTITYFIGKLFE